VIGLRQLEADELGRRDRDAVILWLRNSGVPDRTQLARRLMLASVFAQAAVLGVIECAGCGDRGCWRCR
jgi:hypothetical protein